MKMGFWKPTQKKRRHYFVLQKLGEKTTKVIKLVFFMRNSDFNSWTELISSMCGSFFGNSEMLSMFDPLLFCGPKTALT